MNHHLKSSSNQGTELGLQITDISLPNPYISCWITMLLSRSKDGKKKTSDTVCPHDHDREQNYGRTVSEHGYFV